MTRIQRTRISFQGWRGSPERASEISQRALRELATANPTAPPIGAPVGRIQLTVRVPHGASDGAIATQVASAVAGHLRRGIGG